MCIACTSQQTVALQVASESGSPTVQQQTSDKSCIQANALTLYRTFLLSWILRGMTSLGGRPAVATMLCMTSTTVLPLNASTIRKRQRFCSRHNRGKHSTAVAVAATGL